MFILFATGDMTQKAGSFQIVIKGGKPWGFSLQGGAESRCALTVSEIKPNGKAENQGDLKVGDHVIKINDVQCLSLVDALQLIESAFRTLTILIWRPCKYDTTESFSDNEADHKLFHMYNKAQPLPQLTLQNIYDGNSERSSSKERDTCKMRYMQNRKQMKKKTSEYENHCYSSHVNQETSKCLYKKPFFSGQQLCEGIQLGSNFNQITQASCEAGTRLPVVKHSIVDKITTKLPLSSHNVHSAKTYRSSLTSELNFGSKEEALDQNKNKVISLGSERMKDVPNANNVSQSLYEAYKACLENFKSYGAYAFPEEDTSSAINKNFNKTQLSYIPFNKYLHSPVPFRNNKESSLFQGIIKNEDNCSFVTDTGNRQRSDVAAFSPETFSTQTVSLNNASQSGLSSPQQYKRDIENTINDSSFQVAFKSAVAHFNDNQDTSISVIAHNDKPSCYPAQEKLSTDLFSKMEIKSPKQAHDEKCIADKQYNSLSAELKSIKKKSVLSFYHRQVYTDDYNTQNLIESPIKMDGYSQHFTRKKNGPQSITLTSTILPDMCNKELQIMLGRKSFGFEKTVLENQEEDEVSLNKTNIHQILNISSVTSSSPSPPLPSPPSSTDTEIFLTDDPLPSPPITEPEILFEEIKAKSNYQVITADKKETEEAIYANIEQVQIRHSLVSSSTQTSCSSFQEQSLSDIAKIEESEHHISSSLSETALQNPVESIINNTSGASKVESSEISKSEPLCVNKKSGLLSCMDNLPLTSTYFTTSEPKAKFLTTYSSTFQENEANITGIEPKKEELINSMSKNLEILKLEQFYLKEEISQNDELGKELYSKTEKLAKQNEIEKYKLHIEEMEKITKLQLSLSGRLARAQNALQNAAAEERHILEAKCNKLIQQDKEARCLKEHIIKRNDHVSSFLQKYFSEEENADYEHFIKMKSRLLVDAQELDDKIKLGEEQLIALKNS